MGEGPKGAALDSVLASLQYTLYSRTVTVVMPDFKANSVNTVDSYVFFNSVSVTDRVVFKANRQ